MELSAESHSDISKFYSGLYVGYIASDDNVPYPERKDDVDNIRKSPHEMVNSKKLRPNGESSSHQLGGTIDIVNSLSTGNPRLWRHLSRQFDDRWNTACRFTK